MNQKEPMKVKIKKLHPDAVIPKYAHKGDAGLDLVATSMKYDEHGNIVYGTGLAIEIPETFVGLVFPRSSNCKTNLYLTNSVGVIDSGYRGEIMFKYKCVHNTVSRLKWWWQSKVLKKNDYDITINTITHNAYKVGDRVGQLILVKYPELQLREVEELSDTDRGNKGYGSTGK